MRFKYIGCLALAAILYSCGKSKSEVSIQRNGIPVAGEEIVLQVSKLNGETGVARYSAKSDSNGVARFEAAPDGDSIYHVLLIDSDGQEKTIASGGRGEFGRLGDWKEKGYSIELRRR